MKVNRSSYSVRPKEQARGCAGYLARDLGLPPTRDALERLPGGDLSQASGTLREVLNAGVAFHNSHLDREERRVVEEEFRRANSGLRVIVATTTLAMGVNTPASSVVIAGLTHPDGSPYLDRQIRNLVGRAGPSGFTERGASYLVAMNTRDAQDFWHRYVTASPEDLESSASLISRPIHALWLLRPWSPEDELSEHLVLE